MSDEWVSVKDKLPDEKVSVLTCVAYPQSAWLATLCVDWIEIWDGEPAFAGNYGEVTHWMPLQPPKE